MSLFKVPVLPPDTQQYQLYIDGKYARASYDAPVWAGPTDRHVYINTNSGKGFVYLLESGVVALKRAGWFVGSQQTQLTWSWCTW